MTRQRLIQCSLLITLFILTSCTVQASPTAAPIETEIAQSEATAVSPTPIPTTSTTEPTPTSADIAVPAPTDTAVPPTPTQQSAATHTPSPDTPVPATDTPQPTDEPSASTPVPTGSDVVIEVDGAVLPPGFSIKRFAAMYRPTGLAFDDNGNLFATSFDGSVRIFTDTDSDGHADNETNLAGRFNTPLGVAVRPGTNDVYVSSMGTITLLRDVTGDNRADNRIDLVTDLPNGLHQNNNLKFGPDGMLYIGVGSTCDVCSELDPRSASIMRFDPDTGSSEAIATGLRNPYDIAFHPQTGDLFATDNGRDDLGPDAPQEELNHIVSGSNYGWPDCWDDFQGLGCDGTTKAVAFFAPHSSANSIDFYTGRPFPNAYRFSAFVAVFGSFIQPETETGIAQVILTPDGDTYTGQVSWFAQWPGAMPLGLVEGPDGALYVGDYINDAIYRISYDQ
ncbi:MAG: PQQ-dependent sugar dehydrogenase [Anaerolineales bacterium]|nr:PQQ-dependent sugar dehydrogenase [Anaerolineales bacterium]